jgi:hypothetical protein
MVAAQLRHLCELLQRDFLVEVFLDVIGNPLFLPTGESASKRRYGGSTAMQLDELMGKHMPDRLRITRRPRIFDLRLELEGGFPKVAVKDLGLNSISEKRNSGSISELCGSMYKYVQRVRTRGSCQP